MRATHPREGGDTALATVLAPYWVHRRRAPLRATVHRAACPSCHHGQGQCGGGADPTAWWPGVSLEQARQPLRGARGTVVVPVLCRRCLPERTRSVLPPTWQRDLSSLTGREEDVAALLARGQTNRQIAAALGLGEGTVEGHVRHLRIKQRLHSRAEAAAWARERADAGSPLSG